MVSLQFFFFFFSSRRRHTRSLRDWSSDVCSSDLGRLVADALAHAGVAVGVVARSADELDETVQLVRGAGGVAAAAQADVADERALAHAVARLDAELGSPDILVNNAGILGPVGPTWEVD